MLDKSDTVGSHRMDARLHIKRTCPAHASVIYCDHLATGSELTDYWLPTLRVRCKTSNKKQWNAIALHLVIEFNIVYCQLRHSSPFLKVCGFIYRAIKTAPI